MYCVQLGMRCPYVMAMSPFVPCALCMAGYTMAQIVFGRVCDGSNFLCGKNLMKKSEAWGNAQLILKTQSNSMGNSSISFIHEGAMRNMIRFFGNMLRG